MYLITAGTAVYPVNSVIISPNGQTLVSRDGYRSIKIWNLQTGELIRTLEEHSSEIYCLAISADGQTIFSGSGNGSVNVWNLQTGELKRTLKGHLGGVNAVAISADGQTMVSGSGSWNSDGTIKVWGVM